MPTETDYTGEPQDSQEWFDNWFEGEYDRGMAGIRSNQIDWSLKNLTGKLKIENLEGITSINLGDNQITDLEISNCPKLERIICSHNQLTELKINNCPNVNRIYCSHNQLKELDLTDLKKLDKLFCQDNPDLRKEKIKTSPTTQFLNSDTFSEGDGITEQDAQEYVDNLTWQDEEGNELTPDQVTEMDLSNKGLIGDLNLSAFPNLERLDVSNNRIARLGIRNNPKLKELVASNNKLKKIGLSNNGNLETLVLTSNQLTELKVSHLTKLKTLNCAINGLEELDLSNCHSLEGLYCYSNKLKGFLTLSHLSNLQYVYCYRNLLQAIDCTGLVKLKELYCARNPCELTLENCTSLEEIDYSEIAVNVILDLSGLVNLKRISVNHSMDATFFGLSDCKNLEFFSACNTFIVPHVHHFKKLDFSSSSLPKLKYLELCFNDDQWRKFTKFPNSSPTLTDLKLSFLNSILTEREKEAIAKLVKSNPNLKDFYLRDKNISFGSSFGREDDSFFPSLLQYFKNHKIKKISLKEDGSLVITKTKSGLQDDEPSEIIKNDEEIKKDTQLYSLRNYLKASRKSSISISTLMLINFKKSFKNKITNLWKKYYSKVKTINEFVKELLSPAKTLQELEEIYNSIKPLYEYKNKKIQQRVYKIYTDKKLELAFEENARRAQQNAEQEQKWQQEQEKKQREQINIEKSLLAESISSIKTYWTTKKILDISLEEVLGPYWEERFNNKKFDKYPATVEYLRGLIDAWISINRPQKQEEDNSNLSKLEITEELANKFSSIPNFETREKVEELLNSVKDNEEFLQQHPDLTSKSPKEVVIAAKRFEYDKDNKDNKIRQYYNLKEDESLTEEQINEYLYLEAVGQLQENREQTAPPSQSQSDNNGWIIPVLILLSALAVGALGVINYELKRKSKNKGVK